MQITVVRPWYGWLLGLTTSVGGGEAPVGVCSFHLLAIPTGVHIRAYQGGEMEEERRLVVEFEVCVVEQTELGFCVGEPVM